MSIWTAKLHSVLINVQKISSPSRAYHIGRVNRTCYLRQRLHFNRVRDREAGMSTFSNFKQNADLGRSYLAFIVSICVAFAGGFLLKDGSEMFRSIGTKQKEDDENSNNNVNANGDSDAGVTSLDLASSATEGDEGVVTRPHGTSLSLTPVGGNDRDNALSIAIRKATDMLQRVKDEVGTPGLVVAVTVDGKQVWTRGLGYADVENRVRCHPRTSMRIASISKPMTMAMAGRLIEEGRLDLDKPVGSYVPAWPSKLYDGEPVTITTRHIVSHLGGIRHYEKCGTTDNNTENKDKESDQIKSAQKNKDERLEVAIANKKEVADNTTNVKVESEFDTKEYLIKDRFENINDALALFKDDELCSKPGSTFLYTTHGWTLVSAVLEGASGEKFEQLAKRLFKELGLNNTKFDENGPLIYNRARYYVRSARGRLANAPYVDLSYKWAGGGFVSTVADLTQFGNAMLYSAQQADRLPADCLPGDRLPGCLPGYLRAGTVRMLWAPVANTQCSWDKDGAYGMGWGVVPAKRAHAHGRSTGYYVTHTGGAIGTSSALVILPRDGATGGAVTSAAAASGVVVALLANLQGVGLNRVGVDIAKLFENI